MVLKKKMDYAFVVGIDRIQTQRRSFLDIVRYQMLSTLLNCIVLTDKFLNSNNKNRPRPQYVDQVLHLDLASLMATAAD